MFLPYVLTMNECFLVGVVGTPGLIIIMTTNHPEQLEPALIRPGRIDKKIMLGHMVPVTCTREHMIDKMIQLYVFHDATPADLRRRIAIARSLTPGGYWSRRRPRMILSKGFAAPARNLSPVRPWKPAGCTWRKFPLTTAAARTFHTAFHSVGSASLRVFKTVMFELVYVCA